MHPDPHQIGPYQIVRKLGEGGMGVVYLAQDRDFRPVAVKVLRSGPAADDRFRKRFHREAEAARQVARFCTAPVLDVGMDGGIAYIVTEYVDGPDLASVIETRGPMRGSSLEALAAGVATALAAIHQAGVVHRDLKPSNILLSAVGPRVIDFGIARITESDATRSAVISGTPAYMAPEQANGLPDTPATDVFAWGGVMAYAGAGRPPFGTGPIPQVLYRVVHDAPRLDGLDKRLRPLVAQALDKDPSRRPTAQQLLDRLLGRESATPAIATRVVSGAWTPPPTSPAVPDAAAGNRRVATMAAATGIAVAALLAAGVLIWQPWQPPSNTRPQAGPTTTVTVTATTPTSPEPDRTATTPTSPEPDGTTRARTDTPAPSSSAPDVKVLADADTFTTNASGASVPVSVRIASLTRRGGEVTLQWSITNDSAEDRLDLLVLMKGTSEMDLAGIGLIPAGSSGEPIHPIERSGACVCSQWSSLAEVSPGKTHKFHAIFEVPANVQKADIDLMLLGKFPGIPISGG
ncbi:serine/threonine-protein kinase [Nonomuraea sp. PA05]|uniref:serine/threonine-protein kinase n=1 Tax=Nonomuraea sp. PA05 TaxID=2604466 RepID=UPI0016523A94|nr:serine/threonine-protein kinase [Nonomuraea sp. PA05]